MGDFMNSKLSISLLLLILSSCTTATSNISSQSSGNDVIDSSNHNTSFSSSSSVSTITSSSKPSTSSVNDSSNPSTSSNSSTSTTSSTSSITVDPLPEVEIDEQTGKLNFTLDFTNAEALAIMPRGQVNKKNRKMQLNQNEDITLTENILVKKTSNEDTYEPIQLLFNNGQENVLDFNAVAFEIQGDFTYLLYSDSSENLEKIIASKNLSLSGYSIHYSDTFFKKLAPNNRNPQHTTANPFKALIINHETGDVFDFNSLIFDGSGQNQTLVRLNRYNSVFYSLVIDNSSLVSKTIIKRFSFENENNSMRVERFEFPTIFNHYYISEIGEIVYRFSNDNTSPYLIYNLNTGVQRPFVDDPINNFYVNQFQAAAPAYFHEYNGIIYAKKRDTNIVFRFDKNFNILPTFCLKKVCDENLWNFSAPYGFSINTRENIWFRSDEGAFEVINLETSEINIFNDYLLGNFNTALHFTWGNFIYLLSNKNLYVYDIVKNDFKQLDRNIYTTNFSISFDFTSEFEVFSTQRITYTVPEGLGLKEKIIDLNTSIVYETGEALPTYNTYLITPIASHNVLINLINSFGQPPIFEKVYEARRLYNLLTAESKSKVTNYALLLEAESYFRAKYVDELINLIDLINFSTFEKAKVYYDQLSEYEKGLLEFNQTYINNELALVVIIAIENIQLIGFDNPEYENYLMDVRAQYEGLTEEQKILVYNYLILQEAETNLLGE